MTSAIDNADISETARAILRRPWADGVQAVVVHVLADELGVTPRSVWRALAELESANIVSRKSGNRWTPTELRLYSDAETKLKRLCRGIERDGKPGAEYTALINEDEARADRARLMADRSWRSRVRAVV